MAELSTLALGHAEARQELESATRASLATLTRTIKIHNPQQPGRAEQVIKLATKVAGQLGLAPEGYGELRLAALLRNVGKLAVPDGILRKPGPLSTHKWNLVKHH